MAIGYDTTAEHVKPLEGAIVRRYTAGEAIDAGMAVYLSAADTVSKCAGGAVATTLPFVGIALQDVASGGRVDVVVAGPVNSVTGGTAGARVFLSDTAGEVAESAGTKQFQIGFVENATTIFVRPTGLAAAGS
jgi:hypothetical protein